MSDAYTVIDSGTDSLGHPWEVAGFRGGLVVDAGPAPVAVTDIAGTLATARVQLCLHGTERDRFAEAVARAVTPGQPARHGPACGCTPCLAEPSYVARRAAMPEVASGA